MKEKTNISEVRYVTLVGLRSYRIGNDGSVWSLHNNRWGTGGKWKRLRGWLDSGGYTDFSLKTDDGTIKRFALHCLVLEVFVGPRPDAKSEACHENGNPGDNRLENLRWDSRKSNAEDMVKHGRSPKGVRHGMARLTEDDVREIRRIISQKEMSQSALAKKLRVPQGHISVIVNRKSWKHI